MKARHGVLVRSVTWLITGLWSLCRVALITWTTFAVYYSNRRWSWVRLVLAGAFAGSPSGPFSYRANDRRVWPQSDSFSGVVVWWICIAPSHDRHWRPEVAVMPRATIDGDRVRLTGVRNFDYRSTNDFIGAV